jgi:hypothetical protein
VLQLYICVCGGGVGLAGGGGVGLAGFGVGSAGFGVGFGGGVGVAGVQSASVMGPHAVVPFWQCATAFFGQGHVKELVGFASRT